MYRPLRDRSRDGTCVTGHQLGRRVDNSTRTSARRSVGREGSGPRSQAADDQDNDRSSAITETQQYFKHGLCPNVPWPAAPARTRIRALSNLAGAWRYSTRDSKVRTIRRPRSYVPERVATQRLRSAATVDPSLEYQKVQTSSAEACRCPGLGFRRAAGRRAPRELATCAQDALENRRG